MKRTRTNWTKKATILLAAICVALAALSGFTPSGAQDWLLQVEGVPVPRAVYSYFLSEALLEVKGKPDIAALRKDVAARCVEYIAISSELRAMEIPVDQVLKSQVADQTAFYWRVLGSYYRSIGVDKPTLNAVLTGRAARDQLFRAIYDVGGTKPTPEESIEAYFYGNYLAYEGIRVFRTVLPEDGSEERDMDTAEAAALRQILADFVENANDDADFYGAAQDDQFAQALSYGVPAVTMVRKGTVDVSDEDFDQLRRLAPEKIMLLNLPGFFLVARGVDMRASPEEFYLGRRADCLWKLKGAAYEAALKELCKGFRADENAAEVERVYREWKW